MEDRQSDNKMNEFGERSEAHALAEAGVSRKSANNFPEKFHFLDVIPGSKRLLKEQNKIYQTKFDGTISETFINEKIRIFGGGVIKLGPVSEYTRRVPEIIEDLEKLKLPPDTDFLGELIAINPKTGFEDFGLIQSRMKMDSEFKIKMSKKFNPVFLIIFDVVKVAGKDVRLDKYLDRMEILRNSVKDWTNDHIFFVKNYSNGEEEWKKVLENNLEGLIVRENTTFNKGIWKIKRVETQDVYCKGEYNLSDKPGREGLFSSLLCYQLTKDGKEVYVTDVGGGFSEKERDEVQEALNKGLINKDNPLVLEIETFGMTGEGKYRSPTFKRFRFDKSWLRCIIK